ncbi:MAG TPA: peroxiredoxin [Dermatophilaceae bacterium]|nr:peroxiredoxin [Dermatophilaceae bacterium]
MTDLPIPKVGEEAPDFALRDQHGEEIRLSSYRGRKNVLLVFYPFAFSGVCTSEMRQIRDGLENFQGDDMEVLTISCDPIYALRAFADQEGHFFPLLSDFWPHGDVTKAYGVFNERTGAAHRGTFLVDKNGRVAWTLVGGPGEVRDLVAYREALAALT